MKRVTNTNLLFWVDISKTLTEHFLQENIPLTRLLNANLRTQLPNIINWFHGKNSLDRNMYISYLVVTCIPNEQSVIKSSIFMSNGGSKMSIPELIDEGLKVTLFCAGFSIYIIMTFIFFIIWNEILCNLWFFYLYS